jgi:hypothetical protein
MPLYYLHVIELMTQKIQVELTDDELEAYSNYDEVKQAEGKLIQSEKRISGFCDIHKVVLKGDKAICYKCRSEGYDYQEESSEYEQIQMIGLGLL